MLLAVVLLGSFPLDALVAVAHAQHVTVVTTTSSPQVTVGTDFSLEVRADCDSCQVQNLELPALVEFDIVNRSLMRPTSVQMGPNGTRVQESVIHRLRLRPRQPGRVRIEPAVAVVAGQRHAGNAVDLQVLPAAGGQVGPAPPPPVPAPPPMNGVLDGANVDSVAFLRTVADPVDPVVGQQVTVTLLFYTRVAARNLQPEREIATDGFWVHDLIGPNAPPPQSRREVVQGVPYDVHVVRHFAAFPLESGDLVLGSPRMAIQTGGGFMFGSRPEQLVREGVPVTVHVRPLPAPAPRGAVVGRYTIRTQLDRTTIRTGDAVTLTAFVEGEGNLRDVSLTLPDLPGLRVHPPRREDDIRAQGVRVGGTTRMEWLLVAEQPGTYTIPPLTQVVFDPFAERYDTVRSEPLTLTVAGAPVVAPAPAPATTSTAPEEPPVVDASTIGEIRTRSELLRARSPLSSSWAYWLGLLAMPLALALGWGVLAQRARRRAHDQRADRQAAALVREKLETAKRALKTADAGAFYPAVAAALRAALEGRLGESVGSLTHAQLGERLEQRGMSAELRERLVEELEACDFARFSAEAGSDEELERCLSRVRAMVQRLERFTPAVASGEGRA
ncbi:MAG: BatD family protein [Polyangiales bacterium]|nr:protein BatD [Myxococcales bacterium]